MQMRRHQTGATLLIVLFLIAILQLLAVATLNRITLQTRIAANTSDGIQAFHAADAGVLLCARRFEQEGNIPVHEWPGREEPTYWRTPVAFEGAAPAAFEIAASWPHSIKPPQCLVEVWSPVPSEEKMMALITTRGFGSTMNAQAWQQLIMERGHPKEGRNWRSVAARPY
ncbi:conserved exported hypothetical protein [Candidatus Glomeribacter gigasporarum BEG34]|uniref:Type 4 fimbrial biogenesis protein PilX N-terminal domain-containing protein n=1 Tax=Candidatus Glomeribacter gigasporarum BEG34 TaxID=1070319 RepID=G2J8C1_9BURK|nr:pilus assembly PilX N-terminal domain-containing protein [Candidatus Glomeribacter gigasporarum]CCD29018.1 conserved exported hypothetical protein [Candidatus Glomeribacter gigasporarum BEG34]